jgi:predicted negative regulator of RcsB-dependent stress response
VAELRSEEEQVEALKRWWNENGKALLMGIAIAILGVVGWNYYQDQQRQTAETASAYFQRLLGNASASPMGDNERAAIEQDAQMLKDQYSDGAYAQYAALMLAKLAVADNNLEQAESELRWLLINGPESELVALANIRLAQVLQAQGRLSQALELVQGGNDGWQGRRLEVKGDILLAQGDAGGAREAYTKAKQVATDQGANTALLSLKLDNLVE